MTIREEQRDLFTVPQGYYLAHCISGDYALGAGIAKQFVEVYNMKNKLFHIYAISTIDEGIELLTGVPAGSKDENGKYPAGTVNYLVYQKLKKYAKISRDNK